MTETEAESAPAVDVTWPRVTGKAISDYLGFTAPWLRKLEQANFVERGSDSLFDAGEVCRGYIRWLKDDARRNTKTEGAKAIEAEKLRRMRIDTAKVLGELVDMETVDLAFTEIFTLLRAEIGAVPAAVTRDLSLRTHIESVMNDAFARCRTGFEKLKDHLSVGGAEISADEIDE